jgi:hypothetical protein
MAVSPVNAGSNYVSLVQPQPQTHAERVTEKENDSLRDSREKVVETTPPPKPTVNTSGQTVGTVVNVKA